MTEPQIDQLHEWDRRHYWHSFSPMADYEPLVIERAEGVWLHTAEGQKLMDAASSMWCMALGHNHPRVTAAIHAQVDRLAHCTSLGMGADVTVRLAKRLADLAPGDLEKVFFSSDGSSAVEIAMKLAVQYWRQCDDPKPARTKFLSFGHAYHGDTLGATALSGIGRYYEPFEPLLCEVVRVAPPDARSVTDTNPAEAVAGEALARVDRVLGDFADEIAAVIIEPRVQMAAGVLMHPEGFLRGLRALCDKHGVLLIADEIAVGLGRCGKKFACDHEGVRPDLMCLGKHLTAGYAPMAATLATPAIWDAFLNSPDRPQEDRTFYHGHTFSGSPLASAAAMAFFDEVDDGLLEKIKPAVDRLGERLGRLAERDAVVHPRQLGMVAAFDLELPGADSSFADPNSIGRQMARHCRERGVWLRPRPDMIYVAPPLTTSVEEIDFLMDVVEESVEVAQEALAGGSLS
ncbi:Adenosylmethionine-8-amino-7-oxononanoate aminotransferase [Pseudobythopirellula maris]|uniref:Adenosylmethionine-8-amino-7-oxononanoate aminotransferase n=1 Tax=Pseudobythopirellula maris TaxID=2527991 RepID=A0A5C5ZQG5_9BACT|nr:adenosylmethionine--8-amino-7-oxononanoate transaminase [Pseudobythopirellula maris]TWT89689.1 Adenosylmethionine-8-amino-7-oxononanoate aminotransferase [Pseudobythopirellula maris]